MNDIRLTPMNTSVAGPPAVIATKRDESRRAKVTRKLVFSDRKALSEHFTRLGAESLRLRFGAGLSPEALERQAERSLALGNVVHGYFEDGRLRAVAELCRSGGLFSRHGEAAFSVEPEWRKRGIATELFGRLLRSARNRRLKTLEISCLAWNQPMRSLAMKFHADLHLEEGSVVGTILPEAPSSFSLFEEWALDAQATVQSTRQALARFYSQGPQADAPQPS